MSRADFRGSPVPPRRNRVEALSIMYNLARFPENPHRNRAQNIHNASYLVIRRIIDNIRSVGDNGGYTHRKAKYSHPYVS